MQTGVLHDSLKPVAWIIGHWKSICGVVNYPTMKAPVNYCEDLKFHSIGLPLLNYKSITWHDKEKYPMHLESGYVGLTDKRSIVFLIAQNFGVVTLEKGIVGKNLITLNSHRIAHTKFARKEVLDLLRIFLLNKDGKLEYTLMMQTIDTPMTEHVHVVYEKVC